MLVGKHKRRTMLCKNSCRKIRKPKLHSTVRQDLLRLLRPASDYFTSGYWPSQFGRRLLSASYAVYLRCTPIREICPIWRFWRPQKSVSSELLTWLVGNLSAFCLQRRWCNGITHAKLSTWKQRICFVQHLTKELEDSRPMCRTERG